MILPIRAYGDPILRKNCEPVSPETPGIQDLIKNMFETMYDANGIGLAAPQVGYAYQLFIADLRPLAEDEDYEDIAEELKDFKKVFINPKIISETGKEWKFNEGCLSIPDVREDVLRRETVEIEYLDEHFQPQKHIFHDMRARVIQHEYDHIKGVLFTDHLSTFKKKLIKGKLNKITAGNIQVSYHMRFPK